MMLLLNSQTDLCFHVDLDNMIIIMASRKKIFALSIVVGIIQTWLANLLLVASLTAWCQHPASFAVRRRNNKSSALVGQTRRTRQHLRAPGHHHRIFGTPQPLRQHQSERSSTRRASKTDADTYEPYRGGQPKEALAEIFVPQVLPSYAKTTHNMFEGTNIGIVDDDDDDDDDERLWVPQTDCVSFRPLCLCVSGGYYVNLLRVRGAGLLSRHRHPGPVHGHVLKGKWKYLEHDWVAVTGSYIFEPPGEIHTLVVPDGVDEMITLFHVTGALLYCDVHGNVTGAEDVFTKLALAKKHYVHVGLGEDFVQQFVR
jgi:2,4'-dihydroxyacetophenone dioxygenase